MILKRIQTLLTLLFLGSVRMLAQDPFPDVSTHKWYDYATVRAKVLINGVQLTAADAVLAVYNDDEIRGKKTIESNGTFALPIWSDTGERFPVHFKVYTDGKTMEVDQGLAIPFKEEYNLANPYIINLTVVTTNTSAEGWATTCLPFNAAVPEGVTVYAAKSIEDGAVKIEPVECTILPKEKPVLLKTETQASYEWLSRVADGDATIVTNLFKGTTAATPVEAGSVMTLGHATDGNKAIGFWLFNGTTIPANRAYLEKPAEGVRGYTLDWTDEVTGIEAPDMDGGSVNTSPRIDDNRNVRGYDLLGRSLTGKSHLMIINGKKIMVK